MLLAHQVATIDQISQGRLILGVGIATDVPNIRAEFVATGVPWEKRVGRMMEGFELCKALWSGKPVDWNGRWTVEKGTLGPTPYRPGGPPIWAAGAAPASLERTAKHFDGWLPNGSDPAKWGAEWAQLKAAAKAAGRDPGQLTGGMYLTVMVDDDVARANQRLDAYMAQYYGQPAAAMRARQICFAGSADNLAAYLERLCQGRRAAHRACALPATTSATWKRWRPCAARSYERVITPQRSSSHRAARAGGSCWPAPALPSTWCPPMSTSGRCAMRRSPRIPR